MIAETLRDQTMRDQAQRDEAPRDGAPRDEAPRATGEPRNESPCQCVSELAAALVAADPERASDVRGTLADRFPDCNRPMTAALEDWLAASSAPDDAPLQPIMPWRQPTIGENGGRKRCLSNCQPVEPPVSEAASITKN